MGSPYLSQSSQNSVCSHKPLSLCQCNWCAGLQLLIRYARTQLLVGDWLNSWREARAQPFSFSAFFKINNKITNIYKDTHCWDLHTTKFYHRSVMFRLFYSCHRRRKYAKPNVVYSVHFRVREWQHGQEQCTCMYEHIDCCGLGAFACREAHV